MYRCTQDCPGHEYENITCGDLLRLSQMHYDQAENRHAIRMYEANAMANQMGQRRQLDYLLPDAGPTETLKELRELREEVKREREMRRQWEAKCVDQHGTIGALQAEVEELSTEVVFLTRELERHDPRLVAARRRNKK